MEGLDVSIDIFRCRELFWYQMALVVQWVIGTVTESHALHRRQHIIRLPQEPWLRSNFLSYLR